LRAHFLLCGFKSSPTINWLLFYATTKSFSGLLFAGLSLRRERGAAREQQQKQNDEQQLTRRRRRRKRRWNERRKNCKK